MSDRTAAIDALRAAAESPGGAHLGQREAETLAVFMFDLVDDRKVMLGVLGLTEAEFGSIKRAAESLLGVKSS